MYTHINHTCMHTFVYLYMYAYIHVRMNMFVYIYIYIFIYIKKLLNNGYITALRNNN